MYFISRAKEEMERWMIDLADPDLAYLPKGHKLFDDYCTAVQGAQQYSYLNRQIILAAVIGQLQSVAPAATAILDTAVNCHHNYVSWENHFGENVIVTRKGAVRARKDELGIIPGSMGSKSYTVRGKGDHESFTSCSQGASRRMGRNEAKRQFTLADLEKATEGVECRKDDGVIDETPGAYKNIDAVMAAQIDLVDIDHTLKQVICVKG